MRGRPAGRAAAGLLLGLACVVACSLSPSRAGGEGARRVLAGDAPRFEEPGSDSLRDEHRARFFADRRIRFSVAAESLWLALDGTPALVARIANGGDRPLLLRSTRSRGIWPFSSREVARVVLHVSLRHSQPTRGVAAAGDDLQLELEEDVRVAPGAEATLRWPFRVHLPPDATCAEIRARAVLHPLAVELEGEAERVFAIPFEEVCVRQAPPGVLAAVLSAGEPFAALEKSLAEAPDAVVACALAAADASRARTIDDLVLSLPGPDLRSRRARVIALEWLTGLRFGLAVERWRAWWEAGGAGAAPAASR